MNFIVENIIFIAVALVSGGMLLWPLLNKAAAGPQVDTLAATRLINDGAVIVDVREPAEYAAGRLNNATNIPVADMEKRAGDIASGKPVLVYCNGGQKSGKAAALLKKAGREQVFSLSGGIDAWKQAGLPISK